MKPASKIKIYGYSFKSRSRKNVIAEANKMSLFTTIPQAQDIVSKRHLVLEGNPLFYSLGETLRAWKGYRSYADNLGEMYGQD